MENKIEKDKSKTPPKKSSAGFSTSKKQIDKVEINPEVPSVMSEQTGRAVVLTFGRFNPPTVGHQKLVDAVKKTAAEKNATPLVYLSHSQDSKKNPLSYEDKVAYAKKAFGDLMHVSKARTIIEAMKELQSKYKHVTVVVGSDRVAEFERLLNTYNGKEYTFDSISVESAGERDPDAEGVAGMSASKMRQAVKDNDMEAFKSGLPTKLKSSAKQIFARLKDEMNIREEMEAELAAEGLNEAVLNLQQRMKRKIIMRKYKAKLQRMRELAKRRMAPKEKLEVRAQRMARDVARKKFAGQRGVEYHQLAPSDKIAVDKLIDKKGALIKRIAARLFPVVRRKELQRLQSFRSGQALQQHHTPAAEVKEAATHDTADYKIVIDKDGNKRKVKAHRVEFQKEEMITFKEMTQQMRKRGRPAKPETLAKRAAMAKAKAKENGEEDYGPDNGREPDQNIIVQLNKSISMGGKKDVEFDDGKSIMIHPDHAQKALVKYHNLKRPADKLEFIKNISTSHSAFKKMIGEEKDDTDELLTIIESVMDRIEMAELTEEAMDGLKKKAEKSGIPLGVLKQVYKRGVAAWNSGHRPGTTPQQWGFARVNSFITKGKGTWGGADSDLAAKVNKESIEEAKFKVKFKMPKETTAERLYRQHQELRKKHGLPDPEEYKRQMEKRQKEMDAMKNEEADSRLKKSGYHTGLSDSTAKARVAHWKKMDKLSDRDPRAYEPAPGDATAKTKESKHTKKYKEMYGEEVINEDAASHLRAAGAAMKAGKPVVASIHRKIAAALQRGDHTTAQGFTTQLKKARTQKQQKPVTEEIQWNVVDYSNMKPEVAPTVAEMKDFMSAKGGFEHHPEVKAIMSMKEMRAAGLIAKNGKTPVRDRMENDPEDQVFVGSYRSKHFEASPQAQKLYMNLPKGTDANIASLAAIEQDNLFHTFKKVAASKYATPEDLQTAQQHAKKIMKFAADMNLSNEHSYIIDMVRKIGDAVVDTSRLPPSENLADDPRFQSLPKDLNQEPGPGNDKDIDNLSNYLISRNIKAQRKLKIIDAD